jgi:hypothetical protein
MGGRDWWLAGLGLALSCVARALWRPHSQATLATRPAPAALRDAEGAGAMLVAAQRRVDAAEKEVARWQEWWVSFLKTHARLLDQRTT